MRVGGAAGTEAEGRKSRAKRVVKIGEHRHGRARRGCVGGSALTQGIVLCRLSRNPIYSQGRRRCNLAKMNFISNKCFLPSCFSNLTDVQFNKL